MFLAPLLKNQLIADVWVISKQSALFCWSICLCAGQYHTALDYFSSVVSFEIVVCVSSNFVIFFKSVLPVWGSLVFPYMLYDQLVHFFKKKKSRDFELNLCINLRSIDILRILSLLVHEHGISCQLLRSSLISFNDLFKLSVHRLTYSNYIILFDAISEILFLILFWIFIVSVQNYSWVLYVDSILFTLAELTY